MAACEPSIALQSSFAAGMPQPPGGLDQRPPAGSGIGRITVLGSAALVVLTAGSRDPVECRAGRSRLLPCEITNRDNADKPLVAVHHWQPPQLDLSHVPGDMLGILMLEAVSDFRRHHLADLRVWSLSLGDGANRNVAVGNYTDKTITLADRYEAVITFLH
jgi:hypothetical protein